MKSAPKPKIRRAVKSAAVENELKEILEIAKRTDIKGLEIQEIFPKMEESSFKERAKIVAEAFKGYSLSSLCYHFPLKFPDWDNINEARRFDFTSNDASYIFDLTEDTIKEAVLVGKALNVKTTIPIVVHLLAVPEEKGITIEERNRKLKIGEENLTRLKEMADHYSEKSGLNLIIVREGNPPDQGIMDSLSDFHPKDLARTADLGIGTNLDFAHFWLNALYWKEGKGELSNVELSKRLYPEIDLEEAVSLLAPSLEVIHMCDAGPGYEREFEGLEIGKGTFPHSLAIPLICSKLKKDILGTYEIKQGHKDPESIYRSDQFYRKLFREKFNEYFD